MRHVDHGKPPREAASFATKEIALAVLATTMSVVAVFVPVAFMKGIVGRFFYQFGLTVAFAVMISMFVSFTLDPMLSSRILKKPVPGPVFRFTERIFLAIDRVYEAILRLSLRRRAAVIGVAVLAFIGSGFLATKLKSEFLPVEDASEFSVKVRTPLGSSLGRTDAVLETIRGRLAKQPWTQYTFVTIGSDNLQRQNEGSMYVRMTDKASRAMGQMAAMQWAREALADIQDARVSVEIVPRVSGGGFRNQQLQLDIRGPEIASLQAASAKLVERMRAAGGYVDLDTTFETGKPEVDVAVKRDRAADLGVSPAAVAGTVKALIGGNDVAKFKAEGDRFDVAVRLLPSHRSKPEDIEELSVRSATGQLVSLRNVARVREGSGPLQIDRYNRSRQVTVLANLQPGKKVLGDAVNEVRGFVVDLNLPAGYTTGFVGQADTMRESFGHLIFALFLAVIVVYMVLASQFESFVHPFTIMLSLPLSVIGALGALVATGMTMSIFTMIGIIMLMGLVTKNAILLVDYTNTLRDRDGKERNTAILEAGPTRLRPILMTTLAMVFGMLPIAMGTGAGSESRAPMAVAVIGGLLASTLLTLVVVPVVYTIMDDLVHPSRWRLVKWTRGMK
jgi:HAE1 family hydrophobic/amphiphilic exporter-1